MNEPIVNLMLALEHGLTEDEYNKVLEKLGRVPTFTELGIISVMWSEHASYKNSIKYIKTLPKDSPAMLSKAGEENAGVIDIGDNQAICFKIESHNHPSAKEPFHGAATGVGGILRDIFTMGARPICALNSLRFGDISDPEVKRLMKGVVEGIGHYGNCFGVPTVGGEIYFEDAYRGNPLVNAMAVGLLEHKNLMSAKAAGFGNFVVYVGAKTGRDGIHGTTFASEELNDESEGQKSAVQVGDPYTEKLLMEATLEVIEKKLVVGLQDMGAAGLTCSSSEMSAKAETGIEIDTALVPQREKNMSAYEILLSESQERMLLVVTPDNFNAVKDIFEKWDLNIAKIGFVTDDKIFRVRHNGVIKSEIPANFLVLGGEAPVYDREVKIPAYFEKTRNYDQASTLKPDNYNFILKQLLGIPNIASKKAIYSQYDYMIQTNTLIEPGGDAALIRIKNLKDNSSVNNSKTKAIAVSVDCNGRYCFLDPYEGAKGAVAESARNVLCTGAKPIAITNNLNFGNPYKPEVYWTFVEVIRGIKDACEMFGTPVTGGNVSFYNERVTKDSNHTPAVATSIYPTPTIGMLGVLDDISKAITTDFKNEGDIIYLLGENCNEIGGSEYQKLILKKTMGMPPIVDLRKELLLQQTFLELVNKKIIKSAHDCSDGGLAVALFEKCLKKDQGLLGCQIDYEMIHRADFELFGESHARIAISLHPNNEKDFIEMCKNNEQPFQRLGIVTNNRFIVKSFIDIELSELRFIYENAIL
ncbi:MAG: phosphoribosylformylglycinamidine synthase subunit PurL [Candidatus Cloacimonetes bacterium]|nr:phosphoribosylformylglycinamidine synthase subunit PurL [Candidatus Cloacimonadota bacterium]